MALWDKISTRGSVEDRRGMTAGPSMGFGGGLLLIGAVVLFNFLGVEVDPNQLAKLTEQLQQTDVATQKQPPEFAGEDNYEVFVSKVVGSTNDMWNEVIEGYEQPRVVLFRNATQSGCGFASSTSGPHYCPADRTIYLDETFFDELKNRLGGSDGDVAQAYVIAHEVGHHVQNITGLLDSGGGKEQSVRTELQADCFAGLWAFSVGKLGIFEDGEITEAIDAAEAVGDDHIQQTTTGRVNPESWTHGSSAQRVQWFNTGYDTGNVERCNP